MLSFGSKGISTFDNLFRYVPVISHEISIIPSTVRIVYFVFYDVRDVNERTENYRKFLSAIDSPVVVRLIIEPLKDFLFSAAAKLTQKFLHSSQYAIDKAH